MSVVRGAAGSTRSGTTGPTVSRTARQTVAAIVAEEPTRAYRRCEWCGAPCYGRSCQAHRDLADIERESWVAA